MQTVPVTMICRDVPAAVHFFRHVLALPVRQHDASSAEVDLGTCTATLTAPDGAEPSTSEPGLILQIEVADPPRAVDELRRRGASVLVEPVLTEWGTESAFVAGPDGLIVELYRPRDL